MRRHPAPLADANVGDEPIARGVTDQSVNFGISNNAFRGT